MQPFLVKNRISPDKRLFIGNPYEWREATIGVRSLFHHFLPSTLFESIHPPLPFVTSIRLSRRRALFLRLVAKHLAVPIRGGNWVDIGNESEEQITGVGEWWRKREGASSQRGITAFVPRMAREHFPEETRNTISRWILEPTPSATPVRTRRGPSIRLIYIGGCSISPPARGREREGRSIGGR